MSELQVIERKVERPPVKLKDVPVGKFFRFGEDGIHFQRTTMGYSCVNSGEHYPISLDDEYQEVQLAVAVKLEVTYE